MRRLLASLFVAGLVVAAPAPAKLVAVKSPAQRVFSAEIVVVGKVTAIEKETVEAAPLAGSPTKLQYKVAVVQIETALSGANNVTHIKVGFIPPPPPLPPQPGVVRPAIRPAPMLPELKEGQEFIFLLSKHGEANFYVMTAMSPPVDVKSDEAKKDIEAMKKVLAVTADPMKSLKAEKAADRGFAAVALIGKYRAYPDSHGEVEQEPISAEESKLILKGLTEADWTKFDRNAPNGMQAFYSLGVMDTDGWVPPKATPVQPGQPPANFNLMTKDAFVKWLDGPGKDYRIKRIITKKK
jgi:hypothetical protein